MSILISGGGGGGGGATTLSGLTDVTIAALANGQILSYNNVSGQWENQTGITGGLTYKGSFNATTGAPSIANAVQGDFYVISVGGTLYGQTWVVGDHLLINADMGGVIDNAKIDKVDNTDQVVSVNTRTGAVTGLLDAANNLSDLVNVPTARTNLGLGTAATAASSDFLAAANNLSDVANAGTARTNLGLGTAATSASSDFLAAANNLSDVANAGTARTNLGLGTAAVETVGTGANNVVQLDGSSRLPAVDGSQLTNLPSAPVTSVNGATGVVTGLLEAANNLSDVANAGTARTNLGLGTAATAASSDFLAAANNLSDVANAGTARTNLGLGTAAVEAVGTGANNVVQLDGSSRLPAVDGSQLTNLPSAPVTSVNGATGAVTGLLEASNNLSDVANAGTARTNLGLGTAATAASSDFLAAANNLSDVANAGTARTNLGLGTAATAASTDFLSGTGADTLGGNLDVGSSSIVSSGAANIAITPDTTGSIVLDGLNWPQADGTSGQVIQTNGSGQLSFVNQSGGGGARPTVTTDSSGTDSTISNPAASVLEDIYLVSNGAAAVNITLPTVTGNSGYKAQIKRLGTANVTVTPASGTIDGAANKVLSVQFSSFTCVTDGTNWHII